MRDPLLDFIDGYHKNHGFAPTMRECAEAVGVSSSATIYHRLVTLYDQGVVDWTPGVARTLRVVK